MDISIAFYIWLIAGILLCVFEILTVDFSLLCFGIGCLAAAVMAYLGQSFSTQLALFSVVSVAALLLVRPALLRFLYRGNEAKTNVDRLTGMTGRVVEAIVPDTDSGRIMLEGEDWRAESVDKQNHDVGEKVVVIRVDGTRVLVRAAAPEGEDQHG